MIDITGLRVFKSELAPTHFDDGRPRLYSIAPDIHDEPLCFMPIFASSPPKPPKPDRWCVLVHPSRWEAFYMAVNQPDVFAHPEVQEALGFVKR